MPSLPELPTYLTERHGPSPEDLVPLPGTASRVSEMSSGKRELGMSVIRKLRERFHIPPDLLTPRPQPRGVAA